ncbi:TVP38/TMEM64 family protein [Lutibaculum baratangense]|uniref:TVP38/TMEM64 family membrane protein n=1 Tax=Lutibaculum baratangense AMV1 TaxID=631454 RepID=V4TEJ8_9HYPH|nr:TVP38/TMEM64 family protein [Lutibaculum baratangense]ESR24623.1 hypothetical protein N177_2303 [Lutibaculum baratangense AMV1]
MNSARSRLLVVIGTIVSIALLYWLAGRYTSLPDMLAEPAALREAVEQLGALGPVAVVAAMAAAIIFSPIPSGPIGLASGAAFGPLWGGVLVVAGSFAGATVAFLIGRLIGRQVISGWKAAEALHRRFEDHSQLWLMLAVFLSRLVPFISFDAVSYVAGATPLRYWRFALATFLGVTPISFVITYAGEATLLAGSTAVTVALVILGLVTLVPAMLAGMRGRRSRR